MAQTRYPGSNIRPGPGATALPAAGQSQAPVEAHEREARHAPTPTDVAARTLSPIRADKLCVFTHQKARAEADERFAAIKAALNKTAG